MERRLFWLLYIFAAINGGWSLICYCHRSRLCDDRVSEVDRCDNPEDVCFIQISFDEITRERVDEYACITHFDSVSGNRKTCLEGPVVQYYRTIQCCNNTDRCNEDLTPPLPHLLAVNQDPTTTLITPSAEPRSRTGMELRHDQSIPAISGALAESDSNGQIYIGLTIAIPTFSVILGIVIIIAAILYWFKKPLRNIWQGLVLKQSLVSCSRALFRILCCKKRARAEVLYDVPDYYAAPPLPPRKIPTIECDTKSYRDEIQDEVAPNGDVNNCTASGNPGTEVEFESRVAEIIQKNISYLPSSRVSHLTANPAYGCNIAIAPEILTEENEAYN